MSKARFTPGPLTIKRAAKPTDGAYDYSIIANIDGAEYVVGEAFGRVSETIYPDAEANAMLWAAAPKLAEALQRLHNHCVQANKDYDATSFAREALRSAGIEVGA